MDYIDDYMANSDSINLFGVNMTAVSSDAGSVKVGGVGWWVKFPNGYGDGWTHYAIVGKDMAGVLHDNGFHFFTLFACKEANIYDDDCGDEVEEVISGKFAVYYKDGLVFFVRSD